MLGSALLSLVLVVSPALGDSPHEPIPKPTKPTVDPVLVHYAEHAYTRNVLVWVHAIEVHRARIEHARERARAESESDTPGTRAPRVLASGTGSVNGHPCGGALPPCYVLERESNGSNAQNPDGRSASGYWQIQDATWGGFMGYARAVDAPAWVQDLRASQLAPCNWEPPNYCAG